MTQLLPTGPHLFKVPQTPNTIALWIEISAHEYLGKQTTYKP